MKLQPRWLVVLGALTSFACAQPLTQLVVVVDSDIPPASPNPAIPVAPDQLRELSLSLYGPCDERGECPPQFEDSTQQYNLPGGMAPPFTIGLRLDEDRALGPYVVHGVARLGPEGALETQVSVRAVTAFVPGETRVVPIVFYQGCNVRACPEGQSCGRAGACMPDERDAASLPVWTGALEDFTLPR